MAPTPKRVAIYVRQSKGDELGIDRQVERTAALARARDWTVHQTYTDNDVSASSSRGPGTGWARMLADAKAGKIDTVVAVDLDRLLRTTRDLNVLIDHGLMAVTVDGELDLSTADGEFRATMLAGIARFEVRRKSERQTRANAQRAEMGRPPAHKRLTGYRMDGTVLPEEATVVRELFDRFAAGESLSGLARELNDRDGGNASGKPWIAQTLRGMLTNPRYAGAAIYRGEVLEGVVGSWEPLVSRDRFDAVQTRLNDPRRKTNRHGDTSRKHLGSGVYVCGTEGCGKPLRSGHNGRGQLRYTCPDGHLSRLGDPIDDFVIRVVRGRLGMRDLHKLLVKPAEESRLKELNAARANRVSRIGRFEADYDAELIDARRLRTATEKARAEIAVIDQERATLLADTGLGEILSAPDPVAAFDRAATDGQRRVVKFLLDVTVLPWPRGIKGFDPSSVRLTWR